MAKPDSTNTPSPSDQDQGAPRNDLLLAFLKVARAASARALQHSRSEHVHELLERAHTDLAAAHALARASQGEQAA